VCLKGRPRHGCDESLKMFVPVLHNRLPRPLLAGDQLRAAAELRAALRAID
jgi:hypothetical protein